MADSIPVSLSGVIKLKTLCVGSEFVGSRERSLQTQFPQNVLAHTDGFNFVLEDALDKALGIVFRDQDIDLVFLDVDHNTLSDLTMFITQVREVCPKLPLVVFAKEVNDTVLYLMRYGASWHFTKDSDRIERLLKEIETHVFSSVDWDEVLNHYAGDAVKPRIEPRLGFADLEALNKNPEEQYIIKKLFADSDVVQIFRIDEGFSGSRIYTVKPAHQRKRILKIEAADHLEAARDKQERLIQPRLDQRIGQIRGKVVMARHLGGACYTLAGSGRDTITLTRFLRDPSLVRKELVDSVLEQLRFSLDRLYEGSSDTELRYWAPLYARVLPPELTLLEATLADPQQKDAEFVLSIEELTTYSSVPRNETLRAIREAVRGGEQPEVVLNGFEVSELDTAKGVLYLHDDLTVRDSLLPSATARDHPIVRFKVWLKGSEVSTLTRPVFRRGKRICVRGRVVDSQETIIGHNISRITGEDYSFERETFNLANARFIAPLKNIHYLLWEVGREDMIIPIPQVSPVVHGDLNTSNFLVEVNDEIPVWLIDFTEAKLGHVYFDLAKLEVEFRTHIFYRLFREMVEEGKWDDKTATQFAMLVENVLFSSVEEGFSDFVTNLRDYQPEWYDQADLHFPLYFENSLYFLYCLRAGARTYGPDRFRYHYPVAMFFQSISALKYENLDNSPWWPWAKRLALCCALVSGRQAVEGPQSEEFVRILDTLRDRSAFAVIPVGRGEDRKYLLQWNANWGMFNLIGGKMNEPLDRSFAGTIQRELEEELGIKRPKDYRIVREMKPVKMRQFSRRELVFKDYEFHIFQIAFLPNHPVTQQEYEHFAERFFHTYRENVLVSRAEIERLYTADYRPISNTTKIILQEVGEIFAEDIVSVPLGFSLAKRRVRVSQGRAKLTGQLINPLFGNLVENITLEVQSSPMYDVEKDSAVIWIDSLKAGEKKEVSFWLRPKEEQAIVGLKATYYYDIRGRAYRHFFRQEVFFELEIVPLSRISEDGLRFFKQAGLKLNAVGSTKLWRGESPSHLSRILPPVVYACFLSSGKLDAAEVLEVYTQVRQVQKDAKVVFAVIDRRPTDDGWAQIGTLGMVQFAVLPIESALLYRGLATGRERRLLRDEIERRMGTDYNPYDVRDPVAGAFGFFGRDALVEDLLRRAAEGRPVGIFGLRKMGKSSLLHAVRERAAFPVAIVNFQTIGNGSLEELYERILEGWRQGVRGRYEIELPEFRIPTDNPTNTFIEATRDLIHRLNLARGANQLGLLLDEVELIVPCSDKHSVDLARYLNLLRALRGLVDEGNYLWLVVSSLNPSINRINAWNGEQNPAFNLFQEEYLPPLAAEDSIQMIRNIGLQVQLIYSNESLQAISTLSGGHPFLARQLCSVLYKQRGRQPGQIETADIPAGVERFIYDEQTVTHLDAGIWQDAGNPALWGEVQAQVNQALLLELARADEPVSQDALLDSPDADLRRTALINLERFHFIHQPEPGVYALRYGLLRTWLRRRKLGLE
ncbi:MAG: NUDIX domain-containing protein [Chloroflexota bacterium]|nr:NUDIX domain-containing protein [Chloroflexota bacterium]